jgi:hypothetical protein
MRGYLPHRWPSWFDPAPLQLEARSFGPFAQSRRLTEAGDVVAVATPGHTADHLSIVADDGDTAYFLAGDASYDEKLMLAGKLDGVSADERVAAPHSTRSGISSSPVRPSICRPMIRRRRRGWRAGNWPAPQPRSSPASTRAYGLAALVTSFSPRPNMTAPAARSTQALYDR